MGNGFRSMGHVLVAACAGLLLSAAVSAQVPESEGTPTTSNPIGNMIGNMAGIGNMVGNIVGDTIANITGDNIVSSSQ